MINGKRKATPPIDPNATTAERRRTARIVHDERGNGRVEWVDVPPEVERTTLSLEQSQPVHRPEHGYDPYEKSARSAGKPPPGESAPRAKRDLRKLSEWIKQVRRAEERKHDTGDDQT